MPHQALPDHGGTHSRALWTTYRAVILEVGAVTATGSHVYPGTIGLLDRLHGAGIPIALLVPVPGAVDSLSAAGIADRFDVVWTAEPPEGRADRESGSTGALLEMARRLGAPPSAVAFVGSTAGAVRAARLGGFGLVVGVDRGSRPRRASLDAAGAHLTVADLGELDLGVSRTDPWVLGYQGFDSAHEGHREALTTLGNGRMATRGSLPEHPEDGIHYPGTYVAGLYNRLTSRIHGRTMKEEHLVNLPNWLLVDVSMDGGPWWSSGGLTARDERRELDVKSGVLKRSVTLADSAGRRLRVVQRTFVSMDDPHVAVQQTAVTAEAWSGTVTLRAGIDARVRNSNVPGYVGSTARHLRVTDLRAEGELLRCEVQTKQSRVRIGTAVAVTNDAAHATPRTPLRAQGQVLRDVDVRVVDGATVMFTKVMSLFTSKDAAISAPVEAATARVRTAVADVAALEDRHREAWRRLWTRCAIVLDADPLTQLVLNLHMFHLLQSVSPHTSELDAGVSARGLHGEGYRGHVFWDEVFVTPVVGLRFPQTARALLDYRWRRLGAARAAARQVGLDGAMFPWQSGSDGTEETPTSIYNSRSSRWFPDNSHRQRHVGLAIAWNAWQHFQSTGDRLWLAEKGAEILIEVTRFFVGLAMYGTEDDRFHITGVMGPDEFHDGYPASPGGGLRDNAYTNVLVSWTCSRTRDALELLTGYARDDLVERLGVTDAELARWSHVASHLAIPFHEDGILSQFDGYEDLRELDWATYRQRYGNIGRLDLILEAEGDSTNRYKAGKQPDVVMLVYLLGEDELLRQLAALGYEVTAAQLERTVEYYLTRTTDGSTLSAVVHASVLARMDTSRGWELFKQALIADLDDTQWGTTREGIHLGAMAGTVDIVIRAFAGLRLRSDQLHFSPRMPDQLQSLRFRLDHRGHRIDVKVTGTTLTVTLHPSRAETLSITVGNETVQASGGTSHTFTIRRESR